MKPSHCRPILLSTNSMVPRGILFLVHLCLLGCILLPFFTGSVLATDYTGCYGSTTVFLSGSSPTGRIALEPYSNDAEFPCVMYVQPPLASGITLALEHLDLARANYVQISKYRANSDKWAAEKKLFGTFDSPTMSRQVVPSLSDL